MRFRLLSLLILPALLVACGKTATPVQLDFIGTSTLVSGNRTVSPNDTLTTRAYAVGNDNDLKRLRITVQYEPTRNPIIYPVPLSSYDPKTTPNDDELVFLDSLITPIRTIPGYNSTYKGGELLFVNKYAARSTSGVELWQYTATDVAGSSASRAFRLTARKSDSAAVYHNYTALLRPAVRRLTADSAQVRDRTRRFISLRSGLLLPKYALLNNEHSLQANQGLVDLICTISSGAISLHAPADVLTPKFPSTAVWPTDKRRATALHSTSLTPANFTSAVTTAAFAAAFTGGQEFATNKYSTGTLAKDQVIAFKINENNQDYYGLIQISDVVLGTTPTLTCLVKVQK